MIALNISALHSNAKQFRISTARTVKSLVAVPGILIGLNNWKLGLSLKYKEGDSEQPIALKYRRVCLWPL